MTNDPHKLELARVHSSPEYQQVDHAAHNLYRGMIKLAILGTSFVTLMALQLEGYLDVSFWIIFAPVWIHLAIRLYTYSGPLNNRRRNASGNSNAAIANNNNNNNSSSSSSSNTRYQQQQHTITTATATTTTTIVTHVAMHLAVA